MMINNDISSEGISDLSFDESKFKIRSRRIIGEPEIPTMIKVLVKNRLAKTENQAIAIILAFTIVLVGVSVFFVKQSVSSDPAIFDPALISNN